jgi:hypothetical protein
MWQESQELRDGHEKVDKLLAAGPGVSKQPLRVPKGATHHKSHNVSVLTINIVKLVMGGTYLPELVAGFGGAVVQVWRAR